MASRSGSLIPSAPPLTLDDTQKLVAHVEGIDIIGHDQQMLNVTLKPGMAMWAEPGCMIHCDKEVMSTVDAGGSGGCCCFAQCFKRVVLAGDSLFRVHWKNTDRLASKTVGFGGNFPAKVVPINLDEWHNEVFVKKHAFLAALDPNIKFGIESAGRGHGGTVGKAMLAGQGLFLNKINGTGFVFLSASGAVWQRELLAGETIVVDKECVVAWQTTCHFGYRRVGGVGMMCFGGEGITETTLSGPGKVILQSMPFEKTKALYLQPAAAAST